MRVRDVMSEAPVAVHQGTPVKAAAALLVEHGVTALPVVDGEDYPIGTVTELDLVRDRFPRDPRYDGSDREWRVPPDTVGELISSRITGIDPETDVTDLVRVLLEERVRSVAVIDERRLVGMVTGRDLVRTLARDDDLLARDVRYRLSFIGGPRRWNVRVSEGVAVIVDEFDSPEDRHIARVLAESVPGVLRAECSAAEPTVTG
ncbi:CBS domain-containing protein [Actinopolyspora xinjiangensis]|uniref:CBS domain-containing protein n=2 Tax=Actinopolyspora xinjiangensis TaxID=405564 RepID=A0A1H0RL78_9ACTN|nr:CBS domain-containing protein [Actinopolyspora xinjiangensis]